MVTAPTIFPGDLLAYRGTGLFSRVIRIKTWSPISHVEVALNPHYAITARDTGVGVYALARANLYAVLRPESPLDFGAANHWFVTVIGQGYDHLSLLGFYNLGPDRPHKQHCAEVVTRWYRAAGFHPFAPDYPAAKVSPGMYLSSPHFAEVWRA